ncbi:zincin, partial [Linderina pennispora]
MAAVVVQGRSTRNSEAQLSRYEFLADPVVHRFTAPQHVSKRSFHERQSLQDMIDDGTFHPNHDLLHPEAVQHRTQQDGTIVRSAVATPRHRAVFRDASAGGRAVLDGVFSVNGETFYVKPASAYTATKRDSDPMLANAYARDRRMRNLRGSGRRMSAGAQDPVHGGGGRLHVRQGRLQILSDWNQASAVYERQLNVALGLIELQIEELTCPDQIDNKKAWNRACSDPYTIDKRLSDFSAWRGAKGKDSAGLWHLMTNCPTGTEVGLAWVGTMWGVSSGTGVSAVSRDEWKVVAHEVGHNFGASHDCTNQECPCSGNACNSCCPCADGCDCKGRYLMNPTSPVTSDDFSPCSVRNICKTIKSTGVQCLQDPGGRSILATAMCGNGIKESGEECDCAQAGAQCADANDLCCNQCKIRPKDSVCRAKYSECDIAEVCDGQSPTCPETVTNGSLKCASGQCTSRDAQCAARGGSDGLTQRCTISVGGDPCDLQCSRPGSLGMLGFHAQCRSGKCKGENWFYQFLLLFQRNLAISIPVAIAVGLILLCIIFSLCCRCLSCCTGCRRPKKAPPPN